MQKLIPTPALLLFFMFGVCSGSVDLTTNKTLASAPPLDVHPSYLKWKSADQVLSKLMADITKKILPLAVEVTSSTDLSPECSRSLFKLLMGLKQSKMWAFRMLDASGKLPNGLLNGNLNSLGDYEECVETRVPGQFDGQYCLVDLSPDLPQRRPFAPMNVEVEEYVNKTDTERAIYGFLIRAKYFYYLKFRSSVCVPSTCSSQDVQMVAQKAVELVGLELNVTIPNCETKKEKIAWTYTEIAVISIFSTLLLLGITGTLTDIVLRMTEKSRQRKIGVPARCLLCFSFYSNVLRLMKPDDSSDTIKIFHGMKVITLLWVILNHTYHYLNFQSLAHLVHAEDMGREFPFQLIANGFLNVETFFFISAVLVSYGVMKSKEKNINIFLYIFRRFWRLTPAFMLVIAGVFLLPHLASGPVYKESVVNELTEKCRATWWTNLLYINNFTPNDDMCLQWTWYIPVDTHLYFLSLIVLIPLKRNPRIAFLVNAIIFLIGLAVTASLHVHYKLHPTAIYVYSHPEDISYYLDRGYFRTYLHCSAYTVGLCVGYIIATRKNIRIPMSYNILGWLSAFGLALAVLYGVYDWNQGNVPGTVVSTLYMCTNKLAWSLALGWVTVVCMTGNAEFVTSILSWAAFVPLGRLTYMAYLIHPIIHHVYVGSTQSVLEADHKTMLYVYLGDVVLAYVIAFGLSLLFESPFMALEKVFFSRPQVEPRWNNNRGFEKEITEENGDTSGEPVAGNGHRAVSIIEIRRL